MYLVQRSVPCVLCCVHGTVHVTLNNDRAAHAMSYHTFGLPSIRGPASAFPLRREAGSARSARQGWPASFPGRVGSVRRPPFPTRGKPLLSSIAATTEKCIDGAAGLDAASRSRPEHPEHQCRSAGTTPFPCPSLALSCLTPAAYSLIPADVLGPAVDSCLMRLECT